MLAVALKQLKVLQPVVIRLPVYVMNNLFRAKEAPKVFLHHKPVLQDILLFAEVAATGLRFPHFIQPLALGMVRGKRPYVAMASNDAPAPPFWMTFAGSRPCSLAFYAVPLTDFVNQFCGHSGVKGFSEFISNLLLSPSVCYP